MSPSSGKTTSPAPSARASADQLAVALEVRLELTEPRRDLCEGDLERLHALILSSRRGGAARLRDPRDHDGQRGRHRDGLAAGPAVRSRPRDRGRAGRQAPGRRARRGVRVGPRAGARDGPDRVRRQPGPDRRRRTTSRVQLRAAQRHAADPARQPSAGRPHRRARGPTARATATWSSARRRSSTTSSRAGTTRASCVVAHSANKVALDHLLLGADLGELIERPMDWQPGWEYLVPTEWRAPTSAR